MQMRGANWEGGERCGRRGQQARQSANHGSALVALRPSLTFRPWPWPKCQRSSTRVGVDHRKSLTRDASPWQPSSHYRRRNGEVFCILHAEFMHAETHQVEHFFFHPSGSEATHDWFPVNTQLVGNLKTPRVPTSRMHRSQMDIFCLQRWQPLLHCSSPS